MKMLCFDSDGKGKALVPGGKYLFSFESLLDEKKKIWSFGVEHPIGGDEVLRLDFSKASEGRVKGRGGFYKRITSNAVSSRDRKLIKLFLLQLGRVMELRGSGTPSSIVDWAFDKDSFNFKLSATKNEFIHVEAFEKISDATLSYFKRVRFTLVNKRDPSRKRVKLDLYLSSCDAA